jgi:hypothetical protein
MRAALLLVVLVIAFYWKLAFTDQYVWFDHPDMAYLEIPRLEFMAREFHSGRFPLWDPHLWMGQPLIGQTQPGPLNPLTLLFLLLPLRDGYLRADFLNWYYIVIHLLGALGMFVLCRELGRTAPASVLAACAFSLGGFLGSAPWLDILSGAVWTPWVCLFFVRAARRRRPILNAALSGFFLGLAWLSGHHELPLLVSLALAVAWLAVAVRRNWRALLPGAVSFAIALMVGAAQLWPTIEFGRLARRWGPAGPGPVGWHDTVPYLSAEIYSLTPRALAGIVLPDQSPIGDTSGFTGLTAALLVAIAVLAGWRSPAVGWLVATAAVAIAYAMGAFTPLHGVLYSLLPEIHRARVPVRALHLAGFALAVLAAYGADHLLRRRPAARLPLVAGAAGMLGLALVLAAVVAKIDLNETVLLSAWAGILLWVAVSAWHARRLSRFPLLALLGFFLLSELHAVHTRAWRSRLSEAGQPFARTLAEHRDVAEFLYNQPQPTRVAVNDDDIPVNFGDLHSINTLEGYTAGVTNNLLLFSRHTAWSQRLYAVTHYVGKQALRPDLNHVFRGAGGVNVFQLPDSLPRARAVHQVRQLPDTVALTAAMEKADFDPAQLVLLVGDAPELERCDGAQISILAYAPNRVRLRAEMPCRGMVILADTDYPGWRAYINNQETRIWSAYGALRGVVAPAGVHEIDFRFRPLSVYAGIGITALGAVVVVLLAFPWRILLRR